MKVIAAIQIQIGELKLQAEIYDTPTGRALIQALPLKSSFRPWGDEIYFRVPFECETESGATQNMEVGDIAYWPGGQAVAIFFGPTPMSKGGEPVAYEKVNRLGKIVGDATALKRAKGVRIQLLRKP
ncbi:MAG: cyclophilin-like fold protein [Candidatus Binatia bacterium]